MFECFNGLFSTKFEFSEHDIKTLIIIESLKKTIWFLKNKSALNSQFGSWLFLNVTCCLFMIPLIGLHGFVFILCRRRRLKIYHSIMSAKRQLMASCCFVAKTNIKKTIIRSLSEIMNRWATNAHASFIWNNIYSNNKILMLNITKLKKKQIQNLSNTFNTL